MAVKKGVRKEPRLSFTREERADPVAQKAVHKADKTAKKADKARKKIPTKKRKIRFVDPKTGAVTVRTVTEEIKRPSKLVHASALETAGQGLGRFFHKGGDPESAGNSGSESAAFVSDAASAGSRVVRQAARSRKLHFYKKVGRAEKKLGKANDRALYKLELSKWGKADGAIPGAGSGAGKPGMVNKLRMKRLAKKKYAAAKRGASAGARAGRAARAAGKAVQGAGKLGTFLTRNKKTAAIGVCAFFVLCMVMNLFASAAPLAAAGMTAAAGSYPSADADILAAEQAYAAMENNLKAAVDQESYKASHGYDEYHFYLDPIGHDPHALASLVSAFMQDEWTIGDVSLLLASFFAEQYTLTETVTTEERQEPVLVPGPDGGMVPGPYLETVEYRICTVTLRSRDLPSIAGYVLTPDQYELFSVYLALRGNRPDLFDGLYSGGGGGAGGSTDLSGVDFVGGSRSGNQRIVDIAKSQEGNVGGYPYWSWYGFGGWADWCACFVSWCYNQAGYSEPKFASCTYGGRAWFQEHGQWAGRGYGNIAPGDAIFFDWDLSGDCDHVGIVIGTDGSRVYTVEGNSDNTCRVCSYPLDYQCIAGYGLMN